MLIVTLNHNLPDWTDNLVHQLSKDPLFSKCELMVIDNGSTESLAKTTTHRLEENVFFGGGMNVALEYFLTTSHDYMYFLNNDLLFHGNAFLSQSLEEAKKSDASVYSPTVINASIDQCFWKQMHNWGKGLRKVKWVDFQCPLLRRDLLEKIEHFPDELFLGWGLDFYAGCISEEYGLNTIVSDNNTIAHMNSLTFKSNKSKISMHDFNSQADCNLNNYFLNNSKFKDLYIKLRKHGQFYTV